MNLKAKQTSLVGEIAHTHDFSIGKLSSGYRISNNAISNDLQNLQGTSYYEVNYGTIFLYRILWEEKQINVQSGLRFN